MKWERMATEAVVATTEVRPLGELVDRHLAWLEAMQYADSTLKNRSASLRHFVCWACARDVTRPIELDVQQLEAYQMLVSSWRKANGERLVIGGQVQKLLAVKMFCRWLHQRAYIERDLAVALRFPRRPQSLPRAVLNQAEVERVLRMPDLSTPTGLRDRVMLEVLYATGIRRAELAGLMTGDVDVEREVLFILEGKGAKDRVVPISERALWWLHIYLEKARPTLVRGHDAGHLFLTAWGRAIPPKRLTELVARHVDASGVRKRGSCHLFRHTMATLMLEGGADIRYIQEMLGHSQLACTAVYTRVSIRGLREVYKRTHPAFRVQQGSFPEE